MCVHKQRLVNIIVTYPSRKPFNNPSHVDVLAMESYREKLIFSFISIQVNLQDQWISLCKEHHWVLSS